MPVPSAALPSRTTAHVDRLVATAQREGRAPSLLVGVVRHGSLAHVAVAGEQPPGGPDTQYRIGSITKTLTATLIMQLRDEGRLGLQDPLERHLPGTPAGAVTLRQLLGHVSGMRREPLGDWWERAPGVNLDVLLAGLDPDLLVHQPFRVLHYSNLAYGLLGAVAHRITGEPWRDLVAKRLLSPLGMTRTTYQCEEPFARGYVVHPWHGTLHEEPRHDAVAMAPAGQLWSTAADLARWAGFLADPSAEVIDPGTADEMAVPVGMSDPESWTVGFGLGLQLIRRADRILVGHGGSMPGYLAMLLTHRRSGTGAVAFCNSYNAQVSLLNLCGEVIEAVLDDQPDTPQPWHPTGPPPPEVAPLCGRWWFMGLEFEAGYDAGAGELVIRLPAAPDREPWRFVPDGTDRWRCLSGTNHGETMTVRRDGDGRVVSLDIATFPFTRDPVPGG